MAINSTLTDYALSGLPNIKADLGLENQQQRDARLFATGQAAGQQFDDFKPGLRAIAQGAAQNIPSILENVRKLGVEKGLPMQSKSELFNQALQGYDGTPESQIRAVQSLTAIDPEWGAMMADRLRSQRLEEQQIAATTGFNNARAAQLQAEVGETNALRDAVRPLLADSRFKNMPPEAFEKLGDSTLTSIYNELMSDNGLVLLHGVGNQGETVSVYRDKDNNYLNSQTKEPLRPEEVPETIFNASVVASSGDDMFGGRAAQNALIDRTLQTQNLMFTTEKLLAALEETPDLLTSVAGLATWLDSQRVEFEALQRQMYGQAALNDKVNLNGAEVQDALDIFDLGVNAAVARPLILSLAYSMAAAEQGAQSISDKDIANYLRQIGADQKNPEVMKEILRANATKTHQAYITHYGIIHPSQTPSTDFGYAGIMLPEDERMRIRLANQVLGRP